MKDAPPPYMDNPPMHQQAPPPGFVPHQQYPQQQQTPVLNMTTVVVSQTPFGTDTKTMACPSCRSQISTKVVAEPSTKTHLFALLMCLLGCWPCVCVPYCMDSCQNMNHYCPSCGAFLGSYTN